MALIYPYIVVLLVTKTVKYIFTIKDSTKLDTQNKMEENDASDDEGSINLSQVYDDGMSVGPVMDFNDYSLGLSI